MELVSLGAIATHRRAFTAVQDAKLDARLINTARHFATKGVDFTHEMSLGNATYRRVTGHQGDAIQIGRKHRSAASHTCRSQGRLAPSMAGAHYDDIVRPRACYARHNCLLRPIRSTLHYLSLTNTKTTKDTIQDLSRTTLAKHLSNLLQGFGHVKSDKFQWYTLAQPLFCGLHIAPGYGEAVTMPLPCQ